MRTTLMITAILGILALPSMVVAAEHTHADHDHATEMPDSTTTKGADTATVEVGNKICPVSGEVIAEMGDGKGFQVEHEGKIYNLCCSMCAKDFKKDPEKFIQKIKEELENSSDTIHEDSGHNN